MTKNTLTIGVLVIALTTLVFGSPLASAKDAKYPSKGTTTLSPTPLRLLGHFINGEGKTVNTDLRDFAYVPPDFSLSFALNAVAKSPCSQGDRIVIKDSAFSGYATGTDQLGIGRFVWLLNGVYTSDGNNWHFKGRITPQADYYNFNKAKPGERKWWAELATNAGAHIPGDNFDIVISGGHDVEIKGFCSLSAAGTAIA